MVYEFLPTPSIRVVYLLFYSDKKATILGFQHKNRRIPNIQAPGVQLGCQKSNSSDKLPEWSYQDSELTRAPTTAGSGDAPGGGYLGTLTRQTPKWIGGL